MQIIGNLRRYCSYQRGLATKLAPELRNEIERISRAMGEALESLRYIGDSAQQAYLETEPSRRGLPESYSLRYMKYAKEQVEGALQQYDALHKRLGPSIMKEAEKHESKFALTVADILLARDQLKAQIKSDEEKMEQKASDGLSRDDLRFCE